MKYTSQHCCDKTMDVKMALYHECCFLNCTKSWWKSYFRRLRGGGSPPPLLDPPLLQHQKINTPITDYKSAKLLVRMRHIFVKKFWRAM